MDAIPPDVAKRLLNRDLANLVKRVQSGGKINRSERSMLQAMASGVNEDATLARNYVELAAILGVSRQSINTWKQMDGSPKAQSNGLHDVTAWREFMQRNDLKGGDNNSAEEIQLKARKLLAEVEDRELKVAIKRKEWVRYDEVETTWSAVVAQATSLLRKKFEQELPPVLSGLDAIGIQEECRKAIDEVLAILHGE